MSSWHPNFHAPHSSLLPPTPSIPASCHRTSQPAMYLASQLPLWRQRLARQSFTPSLSTSFQGPVHLAVLDCSHKRRPPLNAEHSQLRAKSPNKWASSVMHDDVNSKQRQGRYLRCGQQASNLLRQDETIRRPEALRSLPLCITAH